MEARDIVEAAWQSSGLSQREFARLIGKSQPMLSKYISGMATPPANILILCMNQIGLLQQRDVSAKRLADRIVRELSGASHAGARQAISHILDSLAMR